MTDFNHFEDFRLAHEGKTPIIVGWVDLYPEDQVEVEEYLRESPIVATCTSHGEFSLTEIL